MAHSDDQLEEFARRYTEAWCSQEPARVAAHYAPSGSLTINDGTPSVGREAITEAARSFMVAFPDLQVLMDDVGSQGETTVYRWTLVGTNTGPGGTGRPVQNQRLRGVDVRRRRSDRRVARSLRPGRVRPTAGTRRGIAPLNGWGDGCVG